jgi:hypothetical protein
MNIPEFVPQLPLLEGHGIGPTQQLTAIDGFEPGEM